MIKIRYVAQIEIEDEIEQNDNILTVSEIRQNVRSGMVENGLRDLIAEGFCKPKITITQQLVDVIEVEE
jgi:hypothetical protein